MVGAAPGRINLVQLHSHIGSVLHGGISELTSSCVCRSFRSAALKFMDGVGEAATATPSGVSLLLLCPRCCSVVSGVVVERGGCVVQEYVQTVVCVGDSWYMVHHVLGLWLETDSSGFPFDIVIIRGFDDMSGNMLTRSDSFNGNDFAYDKLFWKFVKLQFNDEAESSSVNM